MRTLLTRVLPALLVVLLAAGGWLAWTALQAKDALDAARADVQAVRAALEERDVRAARAAAQAAARSTQQARDTTSDPLWKAAAAVPLLGNSLEVTRGLAAAADELASGALPALLDAVETVDPQALRRADGSIDTSLITAAAAPLAAGLDQAEQARARTAGLPTSLVAAPLSDARDELAEQTGELVDTASDALLATEIVPLVLGVDQPRRFFVLIQQNSESRGTGGLPGGFVILESAGGRLRVTEQGSNAELRNGVIPPPPGVPDDYVQHYTGFGAFGLWQNVNVSPDLPVVARVIADRWQRQSGQAVDGLVAVDAQALQDLLRGAGPIPLPGGGSLAPDGVVEYLAVGQYRDFAPPDGSTGIDQSSERKAVLERILTAATSRLVGGGGDTEELLLGLLDAIRSGHLKMTSTDGELGPLLEQAGIDGGLPDGPAPVAYPVVFNSTGGKLEHWLDRSVSYSAGPCEGPRRRSTIAVELRNDAPAAGLPRYLTNRIDADGMTSSLTNAVTLQVYGTRGAELESATFDGEPISGRVRPDQPFLSQTTEAGLPMWHLRVELPRGETRRLELNLVEPVVPGEARVPEQPLSRPLEKTVDVPVC